MKKVLFGLVFAFSAGSLCAATLSDDHTKLKAELAAVGLKVNSVADSVVPGVQEVLTDKGLFFAANNGQSLIEGNIYDLTNKQLVNDKILQQVRKSGIETMQSSMIEFKAKDEKHAITVFTDTSCGYCRKLHSQMHSYNEGGQQKPGYNDLGIEIRYLAYPRAGIPSPSADKLISTWCAKDKQDAMTKLKSDQSVPNATCDNPVAAQFQLGGQLGVNGTPPLFLPDGKLVPGYTPPEELAKTLGI